jgi:hypothetical protein
MIGAGIDENWYQDFAHTAGDQQNIDAFTGRQTTPGWGVELGYSFASWRFWMCRHANTLHYTQHFTGSGSVGQIDGDLDGSFYDLRVGRRVGLWWNTYAEVFGGVTFAYDKLEFRPAASSGTFLGETSRSLETWKSHIGLAAERPLSSDVGLRLSVTYTGTGKTGDADQNVRAGVGLTYKLPVKFDF